MQIHLDAKTLEGVQFDEEIDSEGHFMVCTTNNTVWQKPKR